MEELTESLGKWSNLECVTLDEAFGMKSGTSRQLNGRRNERSSSDIYNRITHIQDKDQSVPWADLAQEYAMSKTKLQSLYYEYKSIMEQVDAYIDSEYY